jgi:hypothetical protein
MRPHALRRAARATALVSILVAGLAGAVPARATVIQGRDGTFIIGARDATGVLQVASRDSIAGQNGYFIATVTPAPTHDERDKISITYTPNPAKVTCRTIYLRQTCRLTDQNGNTIMPKSLVGPGTKFHFLQSSTTAGGTFVDHVPSEADPYYNGEDRDKDSKSAGSSNGTTSTSTTMTDAPYLSDGCYPQGVTQITANFEVCAICKDDGRVLDCMHWFYVRSQGSAAKGAVASGTVSWTESSEAAAAGSSFAGTHAGGCPEVMADAHPGVPDAGTAQCVLAPWFPHPGVPTAVRWDVVNNGGGILPGLYWESWRYGAGGPQLLASGMFPILVGFDRDSVMFVSPPVLPGMLDTLRLRLDPYGEHMEYDEDNNVGTVLVNENGMTGVPPSPATGGLALRVVPNPFRTGTELRFALARGQRVRVAVFDLEGRLVRTLRDAWLPAGEQSVTWSGRDAGDRPVASGIYVVRVWTDGRAAAVRVVMLR